ncbi:MAG: hypothetical protein COW00_05035 [Bdellovibrio sp. CG12_big_fil_rev_8_21_14_0_65_39_13]|nr:MAG: hypothetical protein COW78_13235 [Bdellovibrio sp. CG22_combo_CG10-13_8_21_14_all_39_27]PIQ61174.1 MAG: hypothetical protein COW00_05035 [Bdellovibrio sp. CG12_big_fil_rev_8_21_14_0_65_39_13]PIR34845.1 MAG: hypothetical protein COV37_11310 [Bdellovibrio sp. CG11_big_fil_rev_8_21_14_0_20_39_38]
MGFNRLNNFVISITLMASALSSTGFAAYYDTLPKGVRTMVYHLTKTDTVNSEYTSNKSESQYHFSLPLDSSNLANLSESTQSVLEYLKNISQEAYEKFTFGEYQIDGKANATVQAFGLGWGLTNETTFYGYLPLYRGQVNIDIVRTKQNNHAEVANALQAQGNNSAAQAVANLAQQLPDANGELLQSVIVNYFGYKPIGNWQAQDLGDLELGIIHRLTNWNRAGLAVTTGVTLPTGREDDPDLIQDFAFGDGQADVFGEFGGGYTLPSYWVSFDSFFRYTHQMAATKTLRVPENVNYPQVSSQKGTFKEKLGNKYEWNMFATYHALDWMELQVGHLYSVTGASTYESNDERANRALEETNPMIVMQSWRAAINLTTINSFKRGDFWVPLNLTLATQQMYSGQNTPNYSRYDLELRIFF